MCFAQRTWLLYARSCIKYHVVLTNFQPPLDNEYWKTDPIQVRAAMGMQDAISNYIVS